MDNTTQEWKTPITPVQTTSFLFQEICCYSITALIHAKTGWGLTISLKVRSDTWDKTYLPTHLQSDKGYPRTLLHISQAPLWSIKSAMLGQMFSFFATPWIFPVFMDRIKPCVIPASFLSNLTRNDFFLPSFLTSSLLSFYFLLACQKAHCLDFDYT